MRLGRRDLVILPFLAAAPLLAYLPALHAGRMLAPGDAAALHLPLRVEVWRAYARGELPSWNPSSFSGTPLLAGYRPGAFHPLMVALAPLPSLVAFQALVLVSLGAAGALGYLYARRLGAGRVGGLLASLSFALGPYLGGQLQDTPTIVAAPALPLLLLAAEARLARGGAASSAALAAAVALLALSGSPEADGAGAILLALRLALAFAFPTLRPRPRRAGGARPLAFAAAALAGLLLAAPQLVPTLVAVRESGPGAAFAASPPRGALGGVAGLVVRSVSHTPVAIFALAAVPLVPALPGLRAAAALLCAFVLALAAGGRLEPPGALPLALDLALSLVAGLSLSAQWSARREQRGRSLRRLALVAALFAAAALSIATTVTGPLSPRLSAPVGLLALALILYFALAEARSSVTAGLFLLPLTASFLMQPWGRECWAGAPTARRLEQATPTREAIDRAMGERRSERALALAESWPSPDAAADLAWAGLATFTGRRNANGYDPLVPNSRRSALDGMRADGTLPHRFLESDPARLELLGIRWLQVPTAGLVHPEADERPEDQLDVAIEERRPHLFALPLTPATEVRIVSYLAGAVRVEQGEIVAECVARLASGREIWLPIRAGVDTAEWAWERPDVQPVVRHAKPQVYASFPAREGFLGHQYASVLRLPGRFFVGALRFRGWPGAPPLWLLRAELRDGLSGRSVAVSTASAYASDEVRLAQAAHTPLVTLFEVRRGVGPAWVVADLRRVPDEARVLDLLRSPTRLGLDARREAVATEADVAGLELPQDGRPSPAILVRPAAGRIVVRAAGPGLLVVAEGYDPGWAATVDGRPARIVRVNGDRMAVVLQDGHHRVVLRHHVRGLTAGIALASLGLVLLALAASSERLHRD